MHLFFSYILLLVVSITGFHQVCTKASNSYFYKKKKKKKKKKDCQSLSCMIYLSLPRWGVCMVPIMAKASRGRYAFQVVH